LKIKLIVAVSKNNVIGIKNGLPWHLPDDMVFFKNTTMGGTVIMGRNNYLSIPEKFRPLKNRFNIVLTNDSLFTAKNCLILNSLESAIDFSKKRNEKNIFIIGGGKLYNYALEKKIVDLIYLTRIHATISGDTFFPKINMDNWRKLDEKFHKKDKNHKYDFTFLTLERIS